MPTVASSFIRRHADGLLILAIFLLGINLRPILAVIGPLLSNIQQATGLNSSEAGLLTTLPVLAIGVFILLTAQLERMLGESRGVTIGMMLIALACAARWGWYSDWGLIFTAALGGLGIALVQALLPALIKRRFPARTGQLMGLYTTGIMGGAVFAAASAAPLAESIPWNQVLALWSIPAFVVALLWMKIAPRDTATGRLPYPRLPLRSGRAWVLMVFFGIATSAYTVVLAWLSPFYLQLGWTPTHSGLLLAGLTLTEVGAGFFVSYWVGRRRDRRPILTLSLTLVLIGLGCLIVAPNLLAIPAMIILGLGIGSLFPLCLITTMDHVTDPASAGSLMAFVQGGGYLIASILPFVAGLLQQQFDSLAGAWLIMAAGVVVLLVLTWRFAPTHRLEAISWRLIKEK